MNRIVIKVAATATFVVGMGLATTMHLAGQETPGYAVNVPLSYVEVVKAHKTAVGEVRRGVHRADGSWAVSVPTFAADGAPKGEARIIFDTTNQRHVLFDTELRSVTTSAFPDNSTFHMGLRRACDGEIASTALGYDVTREITTIPYGDGQKVVVEVLRAPALGCLRMQQLTTLFAADGSERNSQVERVVDVTLGDPDNAWFSVPAGYTEMSPQQRLQALNPSVNMSTDLFASQLETNYHQRSRAPIE